MKNEMPKLKTSIARKLNALLAAAGIVLSCASAALAQSPPTVAQVEHRWDFKFNKFVIGAWWGPGATDPEVALYKDAGFNVVMVGRYMHVNDIGDFDRTVHDMDLAQKYGLGAIFDLLTTNDRPWGGVVPAGDKTGAHYASLAEFKWLWNKVGKHPALVGFMLGDDQGVVTPNTGAITQFLYNQPKPRLFPWLCGWIDAHNLADHNNPIDDPEVYPTLYNYNQPADELARQYAAAYAMHERKCRDTGVMFWPMFNASAGVPGQSASFIRFPAYLAVAYGAQGMWYFTYNMDSIEKERDLKYVNGQYVPTGVVYKTLSDVQMTPLYPVAKKLNNRILAWSPYIMGTTSTGLFGTDFDIMGPAWPYPADTPALRDAEALARPEPGKLVQSMSDSLVVGILTKSSSKPLAMVVDCRTSKVFDNLPKRRVTVHFAPSVKGIDILDNARAHHVSGNTISLTLESGGGQLMALEGHGVSTLCATSAIYAEPKPRLASPSTSLNSDDLRTIRAALLRIDISGSNAGADQSAKYIYFNGYRLAQAPPTATDAWLLDAISFKPNELSWIRKNNSVSVATLSKNRWVFSNFTLAVQLANGEWVSSNTVGTVFKPASRTDVQGTAWAPNGVAGPVTLSLP